MKITHVFCTFLIVLVAVSSLAACNPQTAPTTSRISSDVANAIAACSSGIEIEQSVSTKLETDIASALKGASSIDLRAAIAGRIRGLVFTPEVLSSPDGQASFEAYTACVTKQLEGYLPEEA